MRSAAIANSQLIIDFALEQEEHCQLHCWRSGLTEDVVASNWTLFLYFQIEVN